MKPGLKFWNKVLPLLQATPRDPNEDSSPEWLYVARNAEIFDARAIGAEFIALTGEAALEEICPLKKVLRLPAGDCYFELDNYGVLAQEVKSYGGGPGGFANEIVERLGTERQTEDDRGPLLGTVIEFRAFPLGIGADGPPLENWGEFSNGLDDIETDSWSEPFFWKHDAYHDHGIDEFANVQIGAQILAGLLTLLDERLVADQIVPDPAPRLNQARAKKGKLPASGDTHVLTINTGAVRRLARRPTGSHESPRLHWRRGHWRVLHRFSEFERRIWVKRCLVGDPDLGFVDKNYRLVFMPPMPNETVH